MTSLRGNGSELEPITTGQHATNFRVSPKNRFVRFAREEIHQSIPRRFEQLAATYRTHLAVKKGDLAVTYDFLNRTGNRIARAILAASDDGNEPVAVLVENDVMTIATIIGVLKAGKIYVPLDSSFSPAWARFILEDTQAKIVLSENKTLSTAKQWLNRRHTLVDIDSIDSNFSFENLGLEVSPDALAHVLYTSGSTAHPKGVMDNHRNTLHYVMRLTNASYISADDRVTLVRPPSSSGALMNLYLVLLNGASLFPIEIKEAGLHALAEWLRREKITVLHAGGTVFRHFAQQLTDEDRFPDLRLIRLSSGQVFRSDVDLFKRHFPDSLLLHVLSSTEANTYRVHFLDKHSVVPDDTLPVGYAVEDMDVVILDERGRELPMNSVGEIAIRSAYLFPGYWKNPELTSAAFLPEVDEEGRRIFRTGDVGRLQADGCLEYLGRKDFRFKIRGHSIQAEEVELALLKISNIAQAVVTARKDSRGDDRLVAYIVPRTTGVPTVSRLREVLKEALPDYMLPTTFVVLDSLPLNPNGKVNRQALPLPTRARPDLSSPFVEPRAAVESAIAKIWSEALWIDTIGVHDAFLDLGGDSLIASRVVERIGKIFPWSLTMREFFESATVAEISQVLVTKEPEPGHTEKIARAFLRVENMSTAEIKSAFSDERMKREQREKN